MSDLQPQKPTAILEPAKDLLVLEGVVPWGMVIVAAADEVDAWMETAQYARAHKGVVDWVNSSVVVSGDLTDQRFQPYEEAIVRVVGFCLQAYVEHNGYMGGREDQGYRLHRYTKGQTLGVHCDQERMEDPTHPHTRRLLSVTLYLNDDYEGGEIHYPRRDLSLHPTAGSVVMFPSNFAWPHASLPVSEGTKYSVATWVF